MSIRRWTLDADDESIHATVRPDGDWMKASEVLEALAAKEREIERLKEQVERLKAQIEVRKLALEIACSGESGTTAGCMIEATHRLTLIAARAAEGGNPPFCRTCFALAKSSSSRLTC